MTETRKKKVLQFLLLDSFPTVPKRVTTRRRAFCLETIVGFGPFAIVFFFWRLSC